MPLTIAEKRAAFRGLHQEGCFVLPNPWDIGSARLFQHMGFSALASTSSGFAWTLGKPDYALTCEEVLEHLSSLVNAVDLPINADFEAGFASTPEGVAENVTRAVKIGIAGLSIEDRDLGTGTLYETPMALERLRAARAAITLSGEDVLLVARTEALLMDPTAVTQATASLVAFAAAGADCLYAPGVRSKEHIAAMVHAVAPLPLNVLALDADLTLAELADLGVRRISVGGALASAGWGTICTIAEQIKSGSFTRLIELRSGAKMNQIFSQFE